MQEQEHEVYKLAVDAGAAAAHYHLMFRRLIRTHSNFVLAHRRGSGTAVAKNIEHSDQDLESAERSLSDACLKLVEKITSQMHPGDFYGAGFQLDKEGRLRSNAPRIEADNPHPLILAEASTEVYPPAPADWARFLTDLPGLLAELDVPVGGKV